MPEKGLSTVRLRGEWWVQLLVEDMSALMRSVALHNAPLLHQHSCRRMDSGAVAVRDQVPPPGFYKSILVGCPPLHCTVVPGGVYGSWGCALLKELQALPAPSLQSHPIQPHDEPADLIW